MLRFLLVSATIVALLLANITSAAASPPASVPPSGATCGAFYGQVLAFVAHSGDLSGNINPGVLHQGFAAAEAFPGFECPT